MSTPGRFVLLADIGGTNARFALADLSSPTVVLLESKSLPNADFASIVRNLLPDGYSQFETLRGPEPE